MGNYTLPRSLVLIVLTATIVLAAMLFYTRSARAQPAPTYRTVVISADWKHVPGILEKKLNEAAAGRELVSVLPFDQPGKYLAVFKQQAP